jgi:hypothetical protein
MRHPVTQFKSLVVALNELERFIRRSGDHLQIGKPFKQFGGMRSREMLANWLLCVVGNYTRQANQLTLSSDPIGGDGVIRNTVTGETWPTEHVLVPRIPARTSVDVEALILKAIASKQAKGGAAYASGKTLVVFLNAGDHTEWHPNRVARQLPGSVDFAAVWVVALQTVGADGAYMYGVTLLDLSAGDAPTFLVRIAPDFGSWVVGQIQ